MLAAIAIIPSLIVKEDLRRLNMKEVQRSEYIEEAEILKKNVNQREQFFLKTHQTVIDS